MLEAHQVVDCAGTHLAMGLTQGRRTQAEIEAVFRAFLNGPELNLLRPRLLPRAVFQRLARRRARRALERQVTTLYPEQAERMVGIARGGELDLNLLYLGLAAELQLNEVQWVGACSALGVRGARSLDGAPALAKNFDYPAAFRVGFCVRRNAPQDGLRSLDVTVGPLAGSHSGINEAGLAITYNYGYGQDRASIAPPLSLLVQRLLERCRTVSEAEGLVRDTPRAGGAIFLLADAGGDMAAFEISPTRFAVRRGGDTLSCTNHYQDPELTAVDVPHHAVYGPSALPALRGLRVHASSEARLRAAEAWLAEAGCADPDALQAALQDHGPTQRGDDGTLCRHGPYYETTASVVLLPAERTLRVAFGRPCEQRFSEHRVVPRTQRAAQRLPLAS